MLKKINISSLSASIVNTSKILGVSFLTSFLIACSGGGGDGTTNNQISRTDAGTIVEGFEGASDFTFSFESPIDGELKYRTFNISAAGKSDFEPVTGTIENAERGSSHSVTVSVYGDTEIEGDETFGLTLYRDGSGSNEEILYEFEATILNDDLPIITSSSPLIQEGNQGDVKLVFEVSLSETVVDDYTVVAETILEESDYIEIAGVRTRLATQGIDYDAASESLTFNEGQTVQTFEVIVQGDDTVELDEIIRVRFTDTNGNNLLNAAQEQVIGYGTIRTDDLPGEGGFDLSINSGEDAEQSNINGTDPQWIEQTYTVQIEESDKISNAQTIVYRVLGATDTVTQTDSGSPYATLGDDFCANDISDGSACLEFGEVVVPVATESVEISFFVNADLLIEPDEVVEIVLENDQGVEFDRTFHTINNDDNPEFVIVFNKGEVNESRVLFEEYIEAGNQIEVLEGDGASDTTFTIDLELSNPLAEQTEFTFKFDRIAGSNVGTSDYLARNGLLIFEPGEVEPIVFYDDTNYTSVEGLIYADNDYEGIELIGLKINENQAGALEALPIAILDNDVPEIYITDTFGADVTGAGVELYEETNASTTYEVRLAGGNPVALSDLFLDYQVDVGFVPQPPRACPYLANPNQELEYGVDYVVTANGTAFEPSNAITFAEGETEVRFEFELINDSLVECSEYFKLDFNLSTSQALGSNQSTNSLFGEIPNTDATNLRVTSWSAAEDVAGTQSYVLSLDQQVITDVTHQLAQGSDTYACQFDGSTNADASYTAGAVSFDGLTDSLPVTVTVSSDTRVEPDETCFLSVPALTNDSFINVLYCNADQSDCGLAAAEGTVENDDIAYFSIVEDTPSAVCPSSEVCERTYNVSWDKNIAENISRVAVNVLQGDGGQDEAEFGTSVGNPNDYLLEDESSNLLSTNSTEFLIKNSGDEVAVGSFNLTMTAVEDATIEIDEDFTLALAMTADSDGRAEVSTSGGSVNTIIPQNGELQLLLDIAYEDDGFGNPTNEILESTTNPVTYSTNVIIDDDVGNLSISLALNTCSAAYCADASSDFSLTLPGTIQIHTQGAETAVVTNQPLDFQILQDSVLEKEESVSITFTADDGGQGIPFKLFDDQGEIVSATMDAEIQDDEHLSLSISPNLATDLESGADKTTEYTISLDTAVGDNYPTIQLNFSELNSSALSAGQNYAQTSDGDYSFSASQSVHTLGFSTSSASQTYAVTLHGDNVLELDEMIDLGVSLEGSVDTADVTLLTNVVNQIIDNDDLLSIDVVNESGLTEAEGLTGTKQVDLEVSLSNPIASNYPSISYSISENTGSIPSTNNHARIADSDYSLVSSNIVVHSNGVATPSTSQNLSINVNGDNVLELPETVDLAVALDSAYADVTLEDSRVTLTLDNDETLSLEFSNALTQSTAELNSGQSTDIDLDLTLSNPIADNYPNISLALVENNGVIAAGLQHAEIADGDYGFSSGTVVHTNGVATSNATQTYTLSLNGDDKLEVDEVIDLSVTLDGSHTDVTLASNRINYTLLNDDTLNIAVTDATALSSSEQNSGNAQINYDVTLSNDIADYIPSIGLTFTEQSGAILAGLQHARVSDGDYSILTPTVNIHTNGVYTDTTSKTFSINIAGDTTLEVEEIVDLAIALDGTYSDVSLNTSRIMYSILNDDVLNIDIVNATTATGDELDAGSVNVQYEVSLSGAVADYIEDLSLNITENTGTIPAGFNHARVADSDYQITNSTLAIHSNGVATDGSSKTLEFATLGDDVLELDEIVDLSVALAGTYSNVVLNDSRITYGLNNNDSLTLDILNPLSQSSSENNSGSAIANFAFTVSNPIAANYPQILFNVSENTGSIASGLQHARISDGDYSLPSTFEIHDGLTATTTVNQNYSFTVLGDTNLEVNEVIDAVFSLSGTHDDVSLLTNRVNYTAINDDVLSISIVDAINLSTLEADAGTSTLNYSVTLSGGVASYIPNIGLNFTEQSGGKLPTQEYARDGESDYQLVNSMTIHTLGTDTDSSDQTYSFNVVGDSTLEYDELIDLAVSVSSTNTNYALQTPRLTHVISNDDTLEITFADALTLSAVEQDGSNSVNYQVNLSGGVASYIPDIDLEFAENTGALPVGVSQYARIADGDYSITEPSYKLHQQGAFTPATSQSYSFDVAGDTKLEVDELVDLSITPAATYSDVSLMTSRLTYTAENDDSVSITIANATTYQSNETDVAGSGFNYDVSISHDIASYIPTISLGMAVDAGTTTADAAEYSTPASVEIHTNGSESLAANTVPYNFTVNGDTALERNETIGLDVSLVTTANDVTLSTNNLLYTILNDDQVEFFVKEITGDLTGCSSISNESGCRDFEITWSDSVTIVDEMQFEMQLSGDASFEATTQGMDTIDPQDYRIQFGSHDGAGTFTGSEVSFVEDMGTGIIAGLIEVKSNGVDLLSGGNRVVRVNMEDDSFVEPSEELQAFIKPDTMADVFVSAVTPQANGVHLSPGWIEGTPYQQSIALDDTATLTFAAQASSAEPADGGVSQPITFSLDADIASNVPTLAVTPTVTTCGAPCTDAIEGDDFNAPVSDITVHTNNTASISVTNQSTAFFVRDDDIVELDETFAFTLAAANADTSTYLSGTWDSDTIEYDIADSDLLDVRFSLESNKSAVVGNSDEGSSEIYSLSWTNSVDENVPALTINIADNSTGIEGVPADYAVTYPSGSSTIQLKAAGVALAAGQQTIQIDTTGIGGVDGVVENADIVSLDASIPTVVAGVEETGNYAELVSGFEGIDHTINNGDKLTVSLYYWDGANRQSIFDITETDANQLTTYTIAWDKPVESDVPALQINFDDISNVSVDAANSDIEVGDYSVGAITGLVGNVLTLKSAASPLSVGSLNFDLTTVGDTTTEKNEVVDLQISTIAVVDDYIDIDGSNNTISHTIDSEDKLNITISNHSVATNVTENSGGQEYKIVYETDVEADVGELRVDVGFDDGEATYTDGDFAVTEFQNMTGSFPSIQFIFRDSAGDFADPSDDDEKFKIDPSNDNWIEGAEDYKVVLSVHSDYQDYVKVDDTAFEVSKSIQDNDYFTFDVRDTTSDQILNDDVGVMYESLSATQLDNSIQVRLCERSSFNDEIEAGAPDANLAITIQAISSGISASSIGEEAIEAISCSDITLAGTGQTCSGSGDTLSASTTFALTASDLSASGSGDCLTVPVLTVNDNLNINPNKWFEMTIDSTDDRFLSSESDFDTYEWVILNDEFTNLTDTGLIDCLNSNAAGSQFSADCVTASGNGFDKQDADADGASHYVSNRYTYVDNAGLPTYVRNDGDCIQDNSTGFIWIRSPSSGSANPSTSYCGISNGNGKSWRIPSVQEVLTVQDFTLLGEERVFDFNFSGGNPSNLNLDIWINESCTDGDGETSVRLFELYTNEVQSNCPTDGSSAGRRFFVYY